MPKDTQLVRGRVGSYTLPSVDSAFTLHYIWVDNLYKTLCQALPPRQNGSRPLGDYRDSGLKAERQERRG